MVILEARNSLMKICAFAALPVIIKARVRNANRQDKENFMKDFNIMRLQI
jgi:hypothetical protein